ncbi:MAG TPA: PspC domain-containing protein [Candidatus Limnocylindria bacterium]|nr:PspC domain-containing protein [Candidatus Limnocylindria bacterium]
MTSPDTQRTDAPGRLLRRRTSDRVIGGVAGGIGDYFNVDPLLIRIGFVGLIIFGGAGLVLYLVAWLLMPAEGQDASPVEALLRRIGLTPRRIGWIAVVLVAVIFLSTFPIGGPFDGSGYLFVGPLGIDPVVIWAVAVIVAGYLLIRRRETSPAAASTAAAPAAIAPPRAPAVRRPPSPLGWYVYAAVLIAVGILALASQVADVEVEPGQFFGAALAVMGIGLVIGAWWGRARILILLALLVMPLAVGASFVTAPLEGGVGAPRFTPANAAELRDEYRLMSGTMTLDLTELSVGRRPIHIAASVAIGQLVVILPRGASVELRTRAGAGQVTMFSEYTVGTGLDDVYVRHHRYGTTYILDLEVGIGEVLVISDFGGNS